MSRDLPENWMSTFFGLMAATVLVFALFTARDCAASSDAKEVRVLEQEQAPLKECIRKLTQTAEVPQ